MKRGPHTPFLLTLLLLVVLLLASTAGKARAAGDSPAARTNDYAAPNPIRFLTGPNAGEPLAIATTYINAHHAEWGLAAADIADMVVQDRYTDRHNQTTHIFLQQRWQGVPIFGAITDVHIAGDGSIITLHNHFVANVAGRIDDQPALLSAIGAVQAAAAALDLTLTEPLTLLSEAGEPAGGVLVSDGGISLENIPVNFVYQLTADGALRPAWDLSIYQLDAAHWWSLRVAAGDGAILDQSDWVIHDDWGAPSTGGAAAPAQNDAAPAGNPRATSQYNVFPIPVESPNHGLRSLVADPDDALASPYGWHDTNGAAGAEFTITRGNNVWAQEDQNGNNGTGYSPNGGAALTFDFPLNLANQPATYADAAITNLFFWNNVIHDVWYHYGFDEASGNFQENNYGRGGLGSDSVNADAQDGSGTNNANFATPADGSNPRMQMFLWSPAPSNLVTVNTPAAIAGGYLAAEAGFGPAVPLAPANITSSVILVDDGTGLPTEGCNALVNGGAISGNIALIDRGSCNFTVKVKNAQNAGAVAAIVVNNVPGGGVIAMGGTDNTITIPSVMISYESGLLFKGQLPAPGINATLTNPGAGPMLDGDLDNGIIVHEYGHGISTRLTGGPSTSCLNNQEQQGEGWSDWFALMMTIEVGDSGADRRGIGTYALGEPTNGTGIRDYPYSTDMTIDPRTYNDISTASIPHGVGSVWTAMLWDMTWMLIDYYGFDPDLYTGSGGNNIAMQLVIDGLKLQGCSPGFVTSRDAILQADLNNYGGAHQNIIWDAFAKRGLGFGANQGSTNNVTDGTESYARPPAYQYLAPVVATVDPANICSGQDAVYPIAVKPDFSSPVTMSASGHPAGSTASFSVNPVVIVGTAPTWTNLTIGNTGAAVPGSYTITVTGDDGGTSQNLDLTLNMLNGAPAPVTLTSPADAAAGVSTGVTLSWTAIAGAGGYEVDVDTDPAFGSPTTVSTSSTSLIPAGLAEDTLYFWRVRVVNSCATGPYSFTRSFLTGSASCTPPVFNDPSFEGGTPNADWTETQSPSNVPAICNNASCGGPPPAASDGSWWLWFGGLSTTHTASVEQAVTFPTGASSMSLNFDLQAAVCNRAADFFRVYVGGNQVFNVQQGSPLCGATSYSQQSINLDPVTYAGNQTVRIEGNSQGNGGGWSNFYADNFSIDYVCNVVATAADYSDLASSYGVAWHTGDGALRLGSNWTADTTFAQDADNADDDGISFGGTWDGGSSNAVVDVTVSGADGDDFLACWFDWDNDGTFAASEQGVAAASIGWSSQQIAVTIPGSYDASADDRLDSRCRLYESEPVSVRATEAPTGAVAGGEVEDFRFNNTPVPTALRLGGLAVIGGPANVIVLAAGLLLGALLALWLRRRRA